MIDTPEITQTLRADTAVIRFTIPRAEMMQVFGPGVAELLAAVEALNAGPAGPVFAHHLQMSPDTFDFEMGVTVASPIAAAGRVTPGEWPPMTVARTVYQGPYDGLPAAWGEFHDWLKAQDLKHAADLWEVYVVTPDGEPDPAKWRTELSRALLSD